MALARGLFTFNQYWPHAMPPGIWKKSRPRQARISLSSTFVVRHRSIVQFGERAIAHGIVRHSIPHRRPELEKLSFFPN
jgi:hypothetical protein